MRNATRVGLMIMAAVLPPTGGPAAAADRPWVEVRSPRFKVASDAGEDEARDTAVLFEKMRAVFRTLFPWGARDDSRPFVILAARKHDTLVRFEPRAHASIFAAGPDADFVVLHAGRELIRTGDVLTNPYHDAFARYALGALTRRFGTRLPLWYQEGIVQVFSNALIFGNDVQVGRVVGKHLNTLVVDAARASKTSGTLTIEAFPASAIVPLERLIHARRIELERSDGVARLSFAAQSWVFAHFLMFGQEGAHRAKFDRLGALLAAGRSGHDATEEALGDVGSMDEAYREYIRRKQLHFQRLELAVPGSDRWPMRELPAAELAALEDGIRAARARVD